MIKEKKELKEVKLRSELYDNHEHEKLDLREEQNDAVMWGAVIGFALFFVLLIMIILFTR